MIIKMNSKLILVFSVLLISFQSQGQKIKAEKSQADDRIAFKCVEFIKTKTVDFNKDSSPVPFTDYNRLADSLWKNKISYMVSHYLFSSEELDNGNMMSKLGQSITNDKQSPFLRYKLDMFPTGKYMLTVVQGHLN